MCCVDAAPSKNRTSLSDSLCIHPDLKPVVAIAVCPLDGTRRQARPSWDPIGPAQEDMNCAGGGGRVHSPPSGTERDGRGVADSHRGGTAPFWCAAGICDR
jgi:hypothetical protein